MPQVINTNIMSLTAQRNLNSSQTQLATAMQRLSSGLRINSAKDDAAGLAISTRFTTQINGLNTAVRNANDGISLAQTTESALQELTNNLQAIRQLAVQSANATNSDSDRAALDSEVQQRLAEITRISQQTTFNGRHVLNGTFGTAAFQVGANVGETISIDLSQGTEASQIGQVATDAVDVSSNFVTASAAATKGTVSGTFTSTTASASFTIDGTTETIASAATRSASATVAAINTAISGDGYVATATGASGFVITASAAGADPMTITAVSGFTFGTATAGTDAVASGAATDLTLGSGDFSINGTAVSGTFSDAQDLVDAINSKSISGVSAYLDDSGKLALQSNGSGLTIAGSNSLGFATTAISGSLGSANVKTVAGANDVINRVDAALTTVSTVRSTLGAIQNRFDSTISNLQAVSENLSASRSRIEDTDFAAETASMSQAQILQQAGVSMLAQANAAPQLVLKLLQ